VSFLPLSIELVEGAGGWVLTGAQLLVRPEESEQNLVRLVNSGSGFVQLLQKLLPEQEVQPETFTLAWQFAHASAGAVGDEVVMARLVIEACWRLLISQGYQPELMRNVATGEALKGEELFWRSDLGGFCSEGGGVLVPGRTVVLIRALVSGEPWQSLKLQAGVEVWEGARTVLLSHARTVLSDDLLALSGALSI
jgi:hypothetical protein